MSERAKPCLRCGRPLGDTAEQDSYLTCECGLVYAVELVESADSERWMAIFRESGYRIHDDGGDSLVIEQLERGVHR